MALIRVHSIPYRVHVPVSRTVQNRDKALTISLLIDRPIANVSFFVGQLYQLL